MPKEDKTFLELDKANQLWVKGQVPIYAKFLKTHQRAQNDYSNDVTLLTSIEKRYLGNCAEKVFLYYLYSNQLVEDSKKYIICNPSENLRIENRSVKGNGHWPLSVTEIDDIVKYRKEIVEYFKKNIYKNIKKDILLKVCICEINLINQRYGSSDDYTLDKAKESARLISDVIEKWIPCWSSYKKKFLKIKAKGPTTKVDLVWSDCIIDLKTNIDNPHHTAKQILTYAVIENQRVMNSISGRFRTLKVIEKRYQRECYKYACILHLPTGSLLKFKISRFKPEIYGPTIYLDHSLEHSGLDWREVEFLSDHRLRELILPNGQKTKRRGQ